MEEKTTVLVSRKWDNPSIAIKVCSAEIGISIDLKDFIHALAAETKNPTFLFTVAALEKRLKDASEKVIFEMKQQSVKVI